ncbi:GNAT family N-acetyltransferase [Anoxybacteroides tepidamans]|uniref:GNAT family N-acetyltransferase n=1 Tax=Anoxybacteroides tepidamans TaxID=265948 RepID=UPI000557C789|nr:GNAT family N-acetyltransferase [Anoxybacillus tepidamans]
MEDKKEFQIHRLHEREIPQLVALSASVGWDYDEQEIETVMSAGIVYGHKNAQGDIISSAAVIPYDVKLASIGMVIVNENYRGNGLAKELMQTCIDSVCDKTTIMLIATKEGKPLYEKLGFQTVSSVHKFLSDKYMPFYREHGNEEYEVIPLTMSYFTQIQQLDQLAIGADRSLFLRKRIQQAKQGVVVKNHKGDIVGYGLSIKGPVNLIVGPIIAANDEIAICIVDELAKGYEGKLRIDVPNGQASFIHYLERTGFHKVSQPPVMVKNASELPVRNGTLYSIAAQIFG